MVKAEFWDDEKLAKISLQARLTYIGLWTFCDDYGSTKGSLIWLKNHIFPFDDKISIKDFEKWVLELLELNRIIPYSVNGDSYYWIPKFRDHQVINRPSKNKFPSPPDNILDTHPTLTEHSLSDTTPIMDEKKRKRKETKEKEKVPEWVDEKQWCEFLEYRKEIKSPVTSHGEKLLLADLKKLVDAGEDQVSVINQTIKSGKWKGFYPVKNGSFHNQEQDGPRSKILRAPDA
jgi:hypothetical protein